MAIILIYHSKSLPKLLSPLLYTILLAFWLSTISATEGLIKEVNVNGEKGIISIEWGTGTSRKPGSNLEIYRQDLKGNTTWVGYGFVRNSDLSLADTAGTFDGSPLQIGDLVRVQQKSKICSQIGRTVYIIALPNFVQKIESNIHLKSLVVYRENQIPRFFRNRWYTFNWQEKVCDLTKPKLVQRSKIKAFVEIGSPAKGNWVYLEDVQSQKRYEMEQQLFILKTEGNKVYMSRFSQPIVGHTYTLLKRKRKSREIDPAFPIFRIKLDQIYDYVVSGIYDNPRLSKKLSVGAGVKIID